MKELKLREKSCEGVCPNCGSENINWHDSDLQDGFIVYEATCDDCDTEFQEEYRLSYAITTYLK